MRELRVYVGPGLGAEDIRDVLNMRDRHGAEAGSLFEVAHALLIEHKDDRAEVIGVKVEDVINDAAHPNQLDIAFTTSWVLTASCRAQNDAGEKAESECATYTADGFLSFFVPLPRKPANPC